MHTPVITALCLSALLLSACKISITAPDNGSVETSSGAYSCTPGDSCEIIVSDVFFDEVFEAEPNPGYLFVGWKKGPGFFCGGLSAPCPLSSAGFSEFPELMPILESNQGFSLEPVFEVTGGVLFNLRYCEVLIASVVNGQITAQVFGTQSTNNCPQALWEQLDAETIAADYGALAVILNGPRFWVLDLITLPNGSLSNTATGETVFFGELAMRQITTVQIPAGTGIGSGAYKVVRVDRDTVFHFAAGRRVYELQDPEGTRYMMQSFSRIVDPGLQLGELATLGERLALPAGWTFSTRILSESFELPTVGGVAEVIQDDLANTYQRLP